MSNSFSTPGTAAPDAALPAPSPSVSQAASDLRSAAGDKARGLLHTAEEKAAALKERAVESAQHFREVATQRASTFKATASERATAFRATATERASHLRESANGQWQDTRVKAHELHVTAEDYVRQNPTKAVLGALGAGFLLGLMMRR